MKRLNMLIVGLVIMLGLIWGCGPTVKQNVALDQARKAYADAIANPDINTHAPVEMRDASRALEQAENAKTDEETNRAAYLAKRQVELAKAKTDQKLAELKAETLAKENQKVLLESRQKEIEKARLEAERLKKEAEEKAKEVERSRLEAEQLKKDAEAKAKEAEAARLQAETARLQAEKAKEEAERAKEEAKRLEQELADLQAKQTDRGIMLTIGDVLFATGKAELMPGAMRSIDKLAEFLHKYPKRQILIEGHTDNRGSDALNLSLSERRAESVRMALRARGIDDRRITTKGYGKAYPIASNDNEAGRQQNRRVEIIILDEGVDVESVFRK